jgi:hypothetical protein
MYSVSPKKYPYNNRIISIEGTFFGTHCRNDDCKTFVIKPHSSVREETALNNNTKEHCE